jgi:superfamily II DNA/RNA helicase
MAYGCILQGLSGKRLGVQDYVHRIGRTGRAGATGEADSLFTDGDKGNSQALIKIMSDAGQVVPPALKRYAPQKITFDSSGSDDDD